MAVNALLRLSARGEALVAELLRLSDHIPPLFSLADKAEQKLYGDTLLDFAYLKTPALYEHRIENSAELIARDGEVWEAHEPLICRVYDLFDSIYKYIKDFVKCISDLRDGVYIQQTVEGVLLDDDGKQLMCEVLYLYGVLLLLLDGKIDGAVRERIVIAYYRHKGQSAIESIEVTPDPAHRPRATQGSMPSPPRQPSTQLLSPPPLPLFGAPRRRPSPPRAASRPRPPAHPARPLPLASA